jgi:hypothetical protein
MAQLANFAKPADLAKERERFTKDNLSTESESGGFLLFPNTYKDIKQIDVKPYSVNADQMGQIRKMGGIAKMLDMLPGVSNNKNVNLDQSEKDFVCFEAIIQSMTKKERENPQILNASRRKRIAAGSGKIIQLASAGTDAGESAGQTRQIDAQDAAVEDVRPDAGCIVVDGGLNLSEGVLRTGDGQAFIEEFFKFLYEILLYAQLFCGLINGQRDGNVCVDEKTHGNSSCGVFL